MEEKDIIKRLIKDNALFNMIKVVTQRYDIRPNDKDHIGAYIEYQDIDELREDFLNELTDTIVAWIYSSDKFSDLKKKAMGKGKPESAATQEVWRKAKQKFRGNNQSDNLLIQGQMGELLLFQFIQHCMHAIPLLRKMSITTSSNHERFGADAIHYKIENGKNIIILGEAKTYTSKYKFNDAFEDALDSIVNTWNNHRKELNLYVHEDFLDNEMNEVAEAYLNNTLKPVEVQLVSIITYNEVTKLSKTTEDEIKKQIEEIIVKRHASITTNCKLFAPKFSMKTTRFHRHNTISVVAATHCRSFIKSEDFLRFDKAMTYATAFQNSEIIKLNLVKRLGINSGKNDIRIDGFLVKLCP